MGPESKVNTSDEPNCWKKMNSQEESILKLNRKFESGTGVDSEERKRIVFIP